MTSQATNPVVGPLALRVDVDALGGADGMKGGWNAPAGKRSAWPPRGCATGLVGPEDDAGHDDPALVANASQAFEPPARGMIASYLRGVEPVW